MLVNNIFPENVFTIKNNIWYIYHSNINYYAIERGESPLSQNQDNFKRGTAELLVLHLLQKEDLYGYQITQFFAQKSKGSYTMLEGSLYPILYRLVDAGYLSDYTKTVGKRRQRRYYHLENSGKKYYEEVLKEYDEISNGINYILDRLE